MNHGHPQRKDLWKFDLFMWLTNQTINVCFTLSGRCLTWVTDNFIVDPYFTLQNLNLTDYKLIYDGAFTWRLNQSKQINLHVILLEEIMVLLQVQDDSKLVLKCQSQVATSGGASKDEGKFGHSPIILLHSTIVRPVATGMYLLCFYTVLTYYTYSATMWTCSYMS